MDIIYTHSRLTAAGYLCYLRSVHRLIHESHRLPWREELLKMSPQMLSIVVLLAFVCVVMFKAYIIGIVWRCYKYLAMRQHNLRSMLPYIIPDVSIRQVSVTQRAIMFFTINFKNIELKERDYTTLLPDYDEAIAQSLKQQPPPSYQVAMASTTQLQDNSNSVPTVNVETIAAIPSTSTGPVSITSAGVNTEPANNNRSAIHVV